ncbi:MAG TPA: Hsp20/alpha crystallin family protein [Acidimicrobiales bacterium]|nr:Hsp20/alpha crystallin family protein [Acidimicrobiales bacterium]
MLMRTDPFRDLDRLVDQVVGTPSRPASMPMDAYRNGDTFLVMFDLPGVGPDSIDLTVEKNVLTVHAERTRPVGADDVEMIASERPQGSFSRQLFLGDALDADAIEADYRAGVLTLRIPIAERAKPRKVEIRSHDDDQVAIDT